MTERNPDFRQLRELHLLKITTGLDTVERSEYSRLRLLERAGEFCREIDLLYENPSLQETLKLSPTSDRWEDLWKQVQGIIDNG